MESWLKLLVAYRDSGLGNEATIKSGFAAPEIFISFILSPHWWPRWWPRCWSPSGGPALVAAHWRPHIGGPTLEAHTAGFALVVPTGGHAPVVPLVATYWLPHTGGPALEAPRWSPRTGGPTVLVPP